MTDGRVHVVKLGGSLLEDVASRSEALAAIARAFESGTRLVVVRRRKACRRSYLLR